MPKYKVLQDNLITETLTFPITQANIANGDLVTSYPLKYDGKVVGFRWVQEVPVTTASKLSTLNIEIGTTNLTGGTIALTSAACTPRGKIIESAAITAGNLFKKGDTLSVEASSTTAFVEGTGSVCIDLEFYKK